MTGIHREEPPGKEQSGPWAGEFRVRVEVKQPGGAPWLLVLGLRPNSPLLQISQDGESAMKQDLAKNVQASLSYFFIVVMKHHDPKKKKNLGRGKFTYSSISLPQWASRQELK